MRPSLIRHPYENHLFLSLTGKELKRNALSTIVRYYAEKSIVRKYVTIYTVRTLVPR